MRTLPAGISTQTTTSGAYPGWLLQLTTTTGVLRYTSLDQSFTYNGLTWLSRDFDVTNMQWDGGLLRSCQVVMGDADLAMLSLALNLTLADAPVMLWQVYQAASNAAVDLISGRCGEISFDRTALTTTIEVTNGADTRSAPRTRVNQVVSPTFLLPEGTQMWINGQIWIINRPPV